MIGESKMSLGYVKGKYWVADDRYAKYTERDTYKKLIAACSAAGYHFQVEYSYNAKRYSAENRELQKMQGGGYSIVPHANAYHEHPMIALSLAVRKHHAATPLVLVLALELEVRVLREKLLLKLAEDRKIEDRIEQVLDALSATLDMLFK